MAITAVLSGCNTQQASDLKTYNNPEFGFEFEYPPDWNVLSESQYQRAACYEADYRQTDPSCDTEQPSVVLGNSDGTLSLGINARQCLNTVEMAGGNFICYDEVLPDKGDSAYSGKEKLNLLSDEVRDAILRIEDTFKIAKGNGAEK